MAINVGDAILKIKGDTSNLDRSLDKAQSKTKNALQKMSKHAMAAGVAFTAIGVAGLKVADSARKMNAQLGVTAINLGITVKEMRSLALETTNVTFPLKEVTATFDLLARAGVKDQEVLKDTATAFDTLGDATGYTASQIADNMIPAMKTFGLTAEQIAAKTDTMTFMQRNSTLSMEDFNTMVGYTTPELVAQGLTIEDLTAGLIHMERQGYAPGRVMTREFMKATTKAAKENISLTEALGLTEDGLAGLNAEMEGAVGLTQKYADEANKQFGVMDKLKQKFEELTLRVGSYLTPLEPMLAAMTALGPAMIILATNAKAAAAAQWLLNTATYAFPGVWIMAAIVGLIAGGVALYKNWDKVTAFMKRAWTNIKLFFLNGVEKILGALARFTGWIPKFGDSIKKAHDAVSNMIDVEKVKKNLDDYGKAVKGTADLLAYEFAPAAEEAKEAIDEQTGAMQEQMGKMRDLTNKMKDYAKEQTRVLIKAIDDRMKRESDAHQQKMDDLQDEYDATLKNIDLELNATIKGFQDEIDAIDKQIDDTEDAERVQREEKRKAELKALMAEAKDAAGYKKAKQELANYLEELEADRIRRELEDEKDALRTKMDLARTDAQNSKDLALEAYEYEQNLQNLRLETIMTQLGEEKLFLDHALEDKLQRYDDDEKAFAAMLGIETEEMEDFVAAYNELISQLKDKTVTITTVHQDVYTSATPSVPAPEGPWPSEPTPPSASGGEAPPPFWALQHGGIAMRPISARIAETSPEAVIPLNKLSQIMGGGKAVNIYVELDGRIIGRAIGQPLVDEIRLRTGVKM